MLDTNPTPTQQETLSDNELNGTMAAAQIAHRAQCPFEINAETVIKLCQEVHDRRAAVVGPRGDADSARRAAEEIADRWFRSDLPEQAKAQSSTRIMLRMLAEEVVVKYTAAPADERLRWLLKRIITELPQNRDWLDPDIEREVRELTTTKGDR